LLAAITDISRWCPIANLVEVTHVSIGLMAIITLLEWVYKPNIIAGVPPAMRLTGMM
jgi:hypothetical protein